ENLGPKNVVEDMVQVLKNGGAPRVDGHEAKRSLALILGIYESSKNGGAPIELG
ncbi:MAG: hypothetical protein HOH43_18355, partial [Candidatus Latescibacteria bacterium]|nr:hypothetical protein [Candidatus Latescibacterota bacterium]